MRCFWLTTAFWAITGLVITVLTVALGLYNISARQGHLPGVSWLLHTTYHNSVKLRAPPASVVPDISHPDLVSLGARHYDSACRFCHAAPGERQSKTVLEMKPLPPHITKAIHHWEPRHLYWIVRNGVKMSGMPAWPSSIRTDDVWAVVAFLTRVRSMTPEQYGRMTSITGAETESADAGHDITASCITCHGPARDATKNAFIPRLDILNETYLKSTLAAYRDGQRFSGIMQHAVTGMSNDDISLLAHYYSSVEPTADVTDDRVDQELAEKGKILASGADPTADVPACSACHGPSPTKRSASYPALSGQKQAYLVEQLRLWKSGSRGGGRQSHLMHKVVPTLDEHHILSLAAYYASLLPARNAQ